MAQRFFVSNVVDGDTFDVGSGWEWRGYEGDRVRPAGYDAPEYGHDPRGWLRAKIKLEGLIFGKWVALRNAYRIDRGRLVCEVYYQGRNLADYFPEYRGRRSA